ncbi:MAG: putative sulfate exporter family transporter, partial [Xanthobacteraceae bacterium]
MANVDVQQNLVVEAPLRWRELWLKEDWWAIWLGLGIVVVAYGFFINGASIHWIAVTPAKWSTWSQLGAHFAANYDRYIVQFLVWLGIFTLALTALGHRARDFIPSFAILYALSVAIFAIGQWDKANTYNLEPPLVALIVGLALSNIVGLPRWLDAGFRVEFYIKTGIVLLGATLPFTLILWAGPTAILQASIVSIVTFLVIYWVAVKLGLDKRLAATLGAGGAVCGVSAAIAIAGA